MRLKLAGTVLVATALLMGCSSEHHHKPAPAPSPTTKASSGKLTRDQGAKRYIELVTPYNKALDACTTVLDPVTESEQANSSDLSKIRKACAGIPAANREFADSLTKVSWPAEAQGSVDELVDEVRADQLAWQEISKADSPDDLFSPKYPLTEDGPGADLVRAHLGLPSTKE